VKGKRIRIPKLGWVRMRESLRFSGKIHWFPSSKICSRCNVMKEDLPLGERMFRCEACGLVLDRDLNAARNIARIVFDFLFTVSSTGIQARGEASAGSGMCVSETGLYEAGTGT
jgi:putative transposase